VDVHERRGRIGSENERWEEGDMLFAVRWGTQGSGGRCRDLRRYRWGRRGRERYSLLRKGIAIGPAIVEISMIDPWNNQPPTSWSQA